MVTYPIPEGISLNQVSTITFVNVPAQKHKAIDRNVSQQTTKIDAGVDGAVAVTTKKAEGQIDELQEKSIYAANFRTSRYNTFAEKVAALEFAGGIPWPIYVGAHFPIGVDRLRGMLKGVELFDKFEVSESVENRASLVQLEANVSATPWYLNRAYPITYKDYPLLNTVTISRSVQPLGMPPVKAMFLRQSLSDIGIPQDVDISRFTVTQPRYTEIVYDIPIYMYNDYRVIQAKCADLSVTRRDPRLDAVLFSTFPLLIPGSYDFKLRYNLPGINRITSELDAKIVYISHNSR
jgi:hypothetical protein